MVVLGNLARQTVSESSFVDVYNQPDGSIISRKFYRTPVWTTKSVRSRLKFIKYQELLTSKTLTFSAQVQMVEHSAFGAEVRQILPTGSFLDNWLQVKGKESDFDQVLNFAISLTRGLII